MILVDTSIWIDHFRQGSEQLQHLLENESIFSHPLIVGELACGNLKNRAEIFQLLSRLPQAQIATDTEVMRFIESNHLMGKGLGYIDMHLLASSKLTAIKLWTRDRRLNDAATLLKVNWILK